MFKIGIVLGVMVGWVVVIIQRVKGVKLGAIDLVEQSLGLGFELIRSIRKLSVVDVVVIVVVVGAGVLVGVEQSVGQL